MTIIVCPIYLPVWLNSGTKGRRQQHESVSNWVTISLVKVANQMQKDVD